MTECNDFSINLVIDCIEKAYGKHFIVNIKCRCCSKITFSAMYCYDCSGVVCDDCLEKDQHKPTSSIFIQEKFQRAQFKCPLYCNLKVYNLHELRSHLIDCQRKTQLNKLKIMVQLSKEVSNQVNSLKNNYLIQIKEPKEIKCFGCGIDINNKENYIDHIKLCKIIKEISKEEQYQFEQIRKNTIKNGNDYLKNNLDNSYNQFMIEKKSNDHYLNNYNDQYKKSIQDFNTLNKDYKPFVKSMTSIYDTWK